MRLFIIFFAWVLSSPLISQSGEVYVVTAETLNVRSGPGTNYDIVTRLEKGQKILIESTNDPLWYKMDGGLLYKNVYVYSKYLTKDPNWIKKNYQSGDDPDCYNIIPSYDFSIENYLDVIVESGTDVVVKLMKINEPGNDICYRIAYIRSKEKFKITNIPEGKYYLKIAYGNEWRQKVVGAQCYGKFMLNSIYQRGEDTLDYSLIKTTDGYSIPSYELSLEIEILNGIFKDYFKTDNISEEQFNK